MNKRVAILLSCSLTFVITRGQCPDKDFLQKRLGDLEYSNIPRDARLAELLGYLHQMSSCPYKNDSTHVSLLSSIATVCSDQGDFLNEIKYRQQAIDILLTNAGKPSINLYKLPGRYYWQAVAYDSLNNAVEKRRALDSCIGASMRLNYVDRSTLTSFESRVESFFDVGDFQRCLDYAQVWESLGRKYASNNTGLEHLVGESSVYSSIGWQVKALLQLKNFTGAEELLKNRLDQYRASDLKNYMAMIYSQMAEVQERKGDYAKALSNLNLSVKYNQDGKDYFNCKQATKEIGIVYFKQLKNGETALAYFKKALGYVNNDKSKDLKDASETLDIFANIANVYAAKGEYGSAYHYFQMAFDQVKPGINETYILSSSTEEIKRIRKIHYLAGLIIDKGDACRKQFEVAKKTELLTQAIQIYKVADHFLNKIKAEQTDLQSKLFWRSDSRRLYENAIEACYLQDNLDDAFYFFEKSRAVLLQDQLNEQHWSGQNNILKQAQLEKNIQQLENQMIGTDKDSPNYSDLENKTFNTKQELVKLQEVIKTNDPLYYQSFVDTTSVSIQDVKQKVLNDRQALVELFAGDSAVYVLTVTAQKDYLQKIDKAAFDSLSESYRIFISNADLLNSHYGSFLNLSHRLYELLFRKIDPPPGRIVIAPDGKYFPFEALIVNMQPVTYFLDDHPVTYTYSARYLLNDFSTGTRSNSYTFLGIAPVQYNNGYPALYGSDESLRRVQNYFSDVTNLVHTRASKNNFLNGYYKYKIIQLYTHAKGGDYTAEPTIYFSDSALSLSDLFYESKPSTNLIVLSACETAEGKVYNGEGVFSFNRQFAALGIPSAVSNLWRVDDQASYQITEAFYKYLAKGLPLDVALQKAKKEFKSISSKEKNLPYYWAGSILVGQGNPILLQKAFPWVWVVGVGATFLILVIVGIKIRRSRRKSIAA